jgi:hypothetical protein
MKLLTIPQPRASLLLAGRIVFDTRPEATDYRGPILIHAASALRTELCIAALEEPMATVLKELGLSLATLPRGAVIATAELVDVVEIVYNRDGHVLPPSIEADVLKEAGLGQWRPGLFAYRFENVVRIEPIGSVKGSRGVAEVAPRLVDEVRDAQHPASSA